MRQHPNVEHEPVLDVYGERSMETEPRELKLQGITLHICRYCGAIYSPYDTDDRRLDPNEPRCR
jgi:hypothetical protein